MVICKFEGLKINMRDSKHEGSCTSGFIITRVHKHDGLSVFLFIRMMVGERRLMRMIAYN